MHRAELGPGPPAFRVGATPPCGTRRSCQDAAGIRVPQSLTPGRPSSCPEATPAHRAVPAASSRPTPCPHALRWRLLPRTPGTAPAGPCLHMEVGSQPTGVRVCSSLGSARARGPSDGPRQLPCDRPSLPGDTGSLSTLQRRHSRLRPPGRLPAHSPRDAPGLGPRGLSVGSVGSPRTPQRDLRAEAAGTPSGAGSPSAAAAPRPACAQDQMAAPAPVTQTRAEGRGETHQRDHSSLHGRRELRSRSRWPRDLDKATHTGTAATCGQRHSLMTGDGWLHLLHCCSWWGRVLPPHALLQQARGPRRGDAPVLNGLEPAVVKALRKHRDALVLTCRPNWRQPAACWGRPSCPRTRLCIPWRGGSGLTLLLGLLKHHGVSATCRGLTT